MSLRALGSLLTRRFAPRARGIPIPSEQPVSSSLGIGIIKKAPAGSPAGRPARSLHTLRDLAARDGAYGTAAAATAALAGFVALLYFNKDKKKAKDVEEPEDSEVDEDAMRARFEDWMKEYGRSYRSKEEKARRYEIFKRKQSNCDKLNKRNASKPNGARFGNRTR